MVTMYTKTNHSTYMRPLLRGRLHGNQLRNLSALLDMLYTPSEIAETIGITRRQVYRVYLPMGCPSAKDETGHVFIHGKSFRSWYEETYRKEKLKADEVYCLSCKYVVNLVDPVEMTKGRYRYWLAACPNCGKNLSKAITNRKTSDDQSSE